MLYWQKYQKKMLEKVKAVKDGVILAGDGRHNSMGHCAKFGAYTIFCCTIPMILHFSLIQVKDLIQLIGLNYAVPNLHNTKILNISGTRLDMTKRKTPFFFTFKGLSNSPIFQYLNFSFHRHFNK